MSEIVYTNSYNKKAAAFVKKHSQLLDQYEKTLKLLELNPGHPALKLHKLKGKHSDLYAVSINLQYRISLFFIIQDDIIIPVNVGTHDQVYKY